MELILNIHTEDVVPINSKTYWDTRFETEDWEKNQGKQQTLFFGQLAIDHFPEWLKIHIKKNKYSICDFGCALGQITKLLAVTFPNCEVIGQDISISAIREAKRLYPEVDFSSEDLIQSQNEYDVIFSSNTLEHFYDPHQIIKKLSTKCNKFLIFLLPFYDDLKIEEHFYSFTYANLPRIIEDKFSLVFFKEVDTSRIPNTHWYGKQILVIYAVDSIVEHLEMNTNLTLCQPSKIAYRQALIDATLQIEYERKISEFLTFPIREQLEQSLAQERAEHQATKQKLLHHLETNKIKIILKKLIKLTKRLPFAPRRKLSEYKSQTRYVLYKLYLKSPYFLKTTIRKLYKRRTSDRINTQLDNIRFETQNFIKHVRDSISINNTIFYIQPTVMSHIGDDFFSGGAERYALDMNILVSEMGYNFICIQRCAKKPWIRHYYGLTIIGLPSFSDPMLFQTCASLLAQDAKLVISSPFTLLRDKCRTKNIGISHGIYWDQEPVNQDAVQIANQVKSFDKLVSVDTATVNFIRGHLPSYANNVDYIPNYVNHDAFKPALIEKSNSTITILYPRRLYYPRGFWVVSKILPNLLSEFNHVNFIFCGKGEESEIREVNRLVSKYPGRVEHIICAPDEMKNVYQKVDIVLIPTIHSEGTSLSLIEAMASKKAIIATCVGGITDLITDRFTGLLIKPNDAKQLTSAIRELICDEELRLVIAENAYKKSFAFGIHHWGKKWQQTINDVIDSPANTPKKQFYNFSFLHPATQGILFDKMTQRPQQLFLALSKFTKCLFIEDSDGVHDRYVNNNLVVSGKDAPVDMSGMICYTYLASNYTFIKSNKVKKLIYDVLDHPTIHSSQKYLDWHDKLLQLADIIITSSKILFDEYAVSFKDKVVKYIPNGVAIDDFSKKSSVIPDDFPKGSGKVIGYYGAIAEWFDYALLDKIATRFNDAKIVLIGPCRKDFPEWKSLQNILKQHSNIYHLGEKKYDELFDYAQHFDVAMIPFIINDITLNCSPVKLFEYMALGKPIITTDLPECRNYKSPHIAKNHDEFLLNIEQALTQNDDDYLQILKKEAQENTWDARAKIIVETIHENIDLE